MRILLLIPLRAHLLEGEVNLPAVMQKVAKNVKKRISKKPKDPVYKARMYCRELSSGK